MLDQIHYNKKFGKQDFIVVHNHKIMIVNNNNKVNKKLKINNKKLIKKLKNKKKNKKNK